jgi:hypothetical protein
MPLASRDAVCRAVLYAPVQMVTAGVPRKSGAFGIPWESRMASLHREYDLPAVPWELGLGPV